MNHTYIIRKVVIAKSMAEALKKEAKGQILDIVIGQKSDKKQLVPMVGFAPSYHNPHLDHDEK